MNDDMKFAAINAAHQKQIEAAKARKDLVMLRAGDTLRATDFVVWTGDTSRATDFVVWSSGLVELGGACHGQVITEHGPDFPEGYYFRRNQ